MNIPVMKDLAQIEETLDEMDYLEAQGKANPRMRSLIWDIRTKLSTVGLALRYCQTDPTDAQDASE